ncbi:MAG: hypothetical protein WCI31_05650 [Prolixibacteraceae bacterium]
MKRTNDFFCLTMRSMNPFIFILLFLLIGLNIVIRAQTIPRIPVGTDTPLRPMAGKVYTYGVTILAPYTTPQTFDWYVTDNPGFIMGSTIVTTAIIPNSKEFIDAGTGYHDATTGTNSISIKWTRKAVLQAKIKPYFLVIHYKGTNGMLCEAMNLKVYKIEPFNAFTVDLTNIGNSLDLGLDGSNKAVENKLCAKDIASVSFDGTKMIYDYGVNELVFKIVAANFSGGWMPYVKVSGLAGTQSIESIEWSETSSFTGTNLFTNSSNVWSPGNKVTAPSDNMTENGKTIYLKIAIKNNDYEGTADTPIILSLNGITDDGDEDVHFGDGLADGYTNDIATQIILARPSITSNTGTPAQSFLP